MNDLISRQAVIDLFPNDALEWDTYWGYIAPHFARRMIEELPSAQPEIIRCKDCKTFCRDDLLVDIDGMCGYGECLVLVLKGADFCEAIVHESHYCGWAERKEE